MPFFLILPLRSRIKMRRLVNRVLRTRYKYLILLVLILFYIFGVHVHLLEKDYFTSFEYPLVGDVIHYVNQLKSNEIPDEKPINVYNYKFMYNSKNKCQPIPGSNEKLRLVYIVKSAMKHLSRRSAIRQSWGYEKRFSDVQIRTVFLLGISSDINLQKEINMESEKYGDIVQADFIDTYFNNTIKTMIGFKWVMEYCKNAKFYFFSDDDMYVSTKNVLRFIRNPVNYPQYLQSPITSINEDEIIKKHQFNSRKLSQLLDFELPDDVVLYSGYVFVSSPHRHMLSKWYITLDEYPYHLWPPYIAAGAYILSYNALIDLYYGSFYTKHFRFDDIFLGIVAKKVNIEPFHCSEFYFYKKDYNIFSYRYTIASHGYGDPDELLRIWNEQRSSNNA